MTASKRGGTPVFRVVPAALDIDVSGNQGRAPLKPAKGQGRLETPFLASEFLPSEFSRPGLARSPEPEPLALLAATNDARSCLCGSHHRT